MVSLAEHKIADDLQTYDYLVKDENGTWKKAVGVCRYDPVFPGLSRALQSSIDIGDFTVYESALGIPRELVSLHDCLFQNLPADQFHEWPQRFIGAMRLGVDLSMVGRRFVYWLLTASATETDHGDVRDALNVCARLYQHWIDTDDWNINRFFAVRRQTRKALLAHVPDQLGLYSERTNLAAMMES